MIELRKRHLQQQKKWHYNMATPTYLQKLLLKGQRGHLNSMSNSIPDPIKAQHKIGWLAFRTGFISQQLIAVIHSHYFQTDDQLTGHSWATDLIKFLWDQMLELWELRNEINHDLIQDGKTEEIKQMREEIVRQLNIGPASLPPIHHLHFHTQGNNIIKKDMSKEMSFC